MSSDNFYEKITKQNQLNSKKVYDQFRSNGRDASKFCIIPFTNLILEPDGKVGMCRQKGSEFPIGNIKKNTIKEIWNSERAQHWRKEFLNGKPRRCKQNISHTHCNLCHKTNANWDDIDFSEVTTSPIRKLTANLNGLCNLRCTMCHIWRKPNDVYNDENFWIPARENIFPHLKEVEMLSGEPLIQKDTFKLIDEVSAVNPDCEWSITTNAHYKLSKYIKSQLDKIKLTYLMISIDSLNPETYAQIRQPGNLDVVLKAVDDYIDYNETRSEELGKIDIRFNFLVVKENWKELGEMLEFCSKKKIHPYIAICYKPENNSILSFSEDKRYSILKFYLDTLSWHKIIYSMRVIKALLDSLSPILKIEILEQINRLKKNNSTNL